MTLRITLWVALVFSITACAPTSNNENKPINKPPTSDEKSSVNPVSDFWKNASVYFLLTDRFNNGDPKNDTPLGRKKDGAILRSFEGGDLKGITQKINEGYFTDLGVNALWMTPVIEQIHSYTDEGTGKTYAYHGYWAKDWTAFDPNFGTEAEFAEMVEAAHQKGIRVLMDVVINHTGPVTPVDKVWPNDWVRTGPACKYGNYEETVDCTLVENLPDILTGSDEPVELPQFLKDKWQKEGRLDEEVKSLDAFFERTGFPRAPRYYFIKWFRDWVRKYGLDGFRIDTAKHTEAGIWQELKDECASAFEEWKKENPAKKLDEEAFYMVGEVYGFGVGGERGYSYGDQKVDFFENGFESLINFSFKSDANGSYEQIFSKYHNALNGGALDGVSILNYVTSHDDGGPFDKERKRTFEAATKLMLCPGGVQIYYGDETARSLIIKGTEGDATLRSFMNWEDMDKKETKKLLAHWQKLGQFRNANQAVGAGLHSQLQESPYIFKRTLEGKDNVLVGLDLKPGKKTIPCFDVFPDGTQLKDYYSRQEVTVESGAIHLDTGFDLVLLGEPTEN